ncbi:uncharacterized protein LOC105421493 [Amborella trichopoda]|uniref:uncharacterized protein LOC105421493 n=1 Tax=Amborella trichopoda TaxID=13333 RepID=UPI0005D33758|nr:uncharacterized protein LOC105421493 [Amborella trichopoda]|eukprot:XP_011627307.1 uncharacterized protein LOC105421493 [Amborella trichopoda]
MVASTFISKILKAERFDGTNYASWQRKMGYVIYEEGLQEMLYGHCPYRPRSNSSQETKDEYVSWKHKNMRCWHILLCAMSDSYASEYESISIAKVINDRLNREYADHSLMKQSMVMKKYNELKMSVEMDHMHSFRVLV